MASENIDCQIQIYIQLHQKLKKEELSFTSEFRKSIQYENHVLKLHSIEFLLYKKGYVLRGNTFKKVDQSKL